MDIAIVPTRKRFSPRSISLDWRGQQSEERRKVLRSLNSNFFTREPAQFADGACAIHNVGRFVAFTAVRNGRQVRASRFR